MGASQLRLVSLPLIQIFSFITPLYTQWNLFYIRKRYKAVDYGLIYCGHQPTLAVENCVCTRTRLFIRGECSVYTNLRCVTTTNPSGTTDKFEDIISFYYSPELHKRQYKHSSLSLSSQLHSLEPSFLHSHPGVFNPLQFLVQEEALDDIAMNEATDTSPPSSNTLVTPMPSKTNCWINYISVSALSSLILDRLKKDQENSPFLGITPNQPTMQPDIHDELRQRFCFNIIRHRGGMASITTLQLFKSFTTAL
jgi:hypothetical protein